MGVGKGERRRRGGWRRRGGRGGGGGCYQYTLVDLSRGLGSDTRFERSHATSKTFKLSSLLSQIKLQGHVYARETGGGKETERRGRKLKGGWGGGEGVRNAAGGGHRCTDEQEWFRWQTPKP